MFNLIWLTMPTKEKIKPMKKCPKTKLDKAEKITKQYTQLSNCCSVIADLSTGKTSERHFHRAMYTGGWKLWESDITSAGIDIEEVYEHIRRLANKRRAELECELVKLET